MRDLTALEPEVLPSEPLALEEERSAFRHSPNRRNTYKVLLPVAALALLPGVITGHLDAFDRMALPLLGLLLAGAWALVFRPNVPLPLLNFGLLLGLWAYLLGRAGFVLFTFPAESHLLALSGSVPWMLMALVTHTWMLGRRVGAILTKVVLGLLGFMALVFLLSNAEALRSPALWLLLQTVLAAVVAVAAQRSALRNLRLESRRMAAGWGALSQDALTGLPDQRAFERLLSRGYAQRPAGLAVAVISLDHLDRIQEEFDSTFKQHLTAHVGRVLVDTVRDVDIVGCLKAGEFAVMLRVPDIRAARAACERLRVRVASRPLEGVNPTVSIGLAFYNGQQESATTLLSEAHWALNQLRQDGFNRVSLASPDDQPGVLPNLQAV